LAEEIGRRRFTAAQWREFLDGADAEKERALRSALKGSRPCGAAEWIVTLQEKFKRKLSSSPRGRPGGVLHSPTIA